MARNDNPERVHIMRPSVSWIVSGVLCDAPDAINADGSDSWSECYECAHVYAERENAIRAEWAQVREIEARAESARFAQEVAGFAHETLSAFPFRFRAWMRLSDTGRATENACQIVRAILDAMA